MHSNNSALRYSDKIFSSKITKHSERKSYERDKQEKNHEIMEECKKIYEDIYKENIIPDVYLSNILT